VALKSHESTPRELINLNATHEFLRESALKIVSEVTTDEYFVRGCQSLDRDKSYEIILRNNKKIKKDYIDNKIFSVNKID